jgi:hypothetical protein
VQHDQLPRFPSASLAAAAAFFLWLAEGRCRTVQGNFKMSMEKSLFFEKALPSEPPTRAEMLVRQARSLSSLGLTRTPSQRRRKQQQRRTRPPKLPTLQTTPRLARKLQLLQATEEEAAELRVDDASRRRRRR